MTESRWSGTQECPSFSFRIYIDRVPDDRRKLDLTFRENLIFSGAPVIVPLAEDLVMHAGQIASASPSQEVIPPNLPATIIARAHGIEKSYPHLSQAVILGDAAFYSPEGQPSLGLPQYLIDALTELTSDEVRVAALAQEILS
ncbi:hypothetical protein [Nesterenkonia rhizosphaerae]